MRFLGNKIRMLENIDTVINQNKIDGVVFCDLFAGSGCVGEHFKNRFSIVANDYLYCLSLINKAKLENKSIPKFNKFKKEKGSNPFDYFNNKKYIADLQYFITNNYSPKGGRQFFSEDNAIKIDGIRIEIEELYKNLIIDSRERNYLIASLLESVMGISNTTGTYEAFLKSWDKRAFKPLELVPIEIADVNAIRENKVYNEDSNELIRKIRGDVLYIDPPYTKTDYNAAYHLLESIAKYDYPRISGITGRRKEIKKKAKYNRKDEALRNFEDLFRQAQFKHILLSYSNQGLVPLNELLELAKRFALNGKVFLYEFPFREYKNIRSSKKGDDLKEIILYFEKECNIIKSPLNYTGSKYNIYDDITKVMPKHISTFVDAMGGAFNVGINVVADKVIYNEILPHTFQIIKILLKDNKKELIQKVEDIVKTYGLKKTEKEPYLKLREDYNKTKDIYKLFVLHMFCFQNQMRFNSKMEFNSPIGNCSYNETLTERIYKFTPRANKYELINNTYAALDLAMYDKDTLFYFDPPYFITSATYNDGKRGFIGWDADQETKLADYITNLDKQGYKFILSNVLYHNDLTNDILIECIKTHNFIVKNIDDVGSKNARDEVLITNFDWRDN